MDNITHGLLGAAIGYLAQTSLTTAPVAVTLGDLRYRTGGRGMTTRVELDQDLKVRRIENGGW